MGNARRGLPGPAATPRFVFEEAAAGANVVVALLTEWERVPAPSRPRPARRGRGRTRSVVDGRHALDSEAYQAAGWDYRALGRPVGAGLVTVLDFEAAEAGLEVGVG